MSRLDDQFWAIIFAAYTCEEQQALWLMADTGFRLLAENRLLAEKRALAAWREARS